MYIPYTQLTAVSNKYAPLAKIQELAKENSARHQKESEGLVTNLSH
jgi:hypothetical protein